MINFDRRNFTVTVFVISNDSPFSFNIRGVDLFEIRLLFNEKQKVAIRPPVIQQESPRKYVAASIDPSAGTYTSIDRFEQI